MIRRPPRSTRTDTLFPYTTLFRSTQIARRLALPAQGSVQVEPGRPGGRLADPGRLVAVEQDRLRQAARPSAVAGHRRHPGEQHGGVQRAAGSRHRATDAGWQGDLEGYRHQRRRLSSEEHTSELQSLMRITYAV